VVCFNGIWFYSEIFRNVNKIFIKCYLGIVKKTKTDFFSDREHYILFLSKYKRTNKDDLHLKYSLVIDLQYEKNSYFSLLVNNVLT